MKPTLLLVVLLVTAAPHAVVGQDLFTGKDMLTRCEWFVEAIGDTSLARAEWFEAGVCVGMVRAASFVAEASPTFSLCIPDPSNVEAQVLVVVKYLNDHPEKLNEPDFALILQALGDAFPCP